MSEKHPQQKEDHTKHLLLLGAAGVAGSVILAPYVLPLLGAGEANSAHMWMSFMGGETAPGFYGSGIAGALQKTIASIPLVGSALTSSASVTIPGIGLTMTAGALTTILASAAIGIGGTLLANWLEKREQGTEKIRWSKIIRTVSLATSILISLPSILTGLSIGIAFLGSLINTDWGNQAAYAMASDHGLGATSMVMGSSAGTGALGGFMAVLPHFLTCGGAILPVMLSMFMGKKHEHTLASDLHTQVTLATAPTVELASPTATAPGQPCRVAFRLRDPATGRVLTPTDIATTHTEKLHCMIVDRSLGDYHHLHPQFDAASGLFVAEFTPRSAQPYTAWHDYTPAHDAQVIAHTALPAATRAPATHPVIQLSPQTEVAGIVADTGGNAPLAAGRGGMLHIALRDKTGQPITGLQPIMGAMAHLVGFSADGQNFMHCHPVSTTADGIDFHVEPAKAGPTKFFLQLKRDGQEVLIPFGLRVEPARQFTAREAARPAHSHAMAVA